MRTDINPRNLREVRDHIDHIDHVHHVHSHLSDSDKYESFARYHPDCDVKILINGEEYFADLYYSLLNAKDSIYILGWAVSPELHLIRPHRDGTRLMDVLKQKAEEGVEVKLLIYNEVPDTREPSPNIMVERHPSNTVEIKAWSHHEKVVIIDKSIGYVGGIDLWWGRFDTPYYPLHDLNGTHFPGIDYSNDRAKDKLDLRNVMVDYIERASVPRMPWHDVSSRIKGDAVLELYRHFQQRWNFNMIHENRNLIEVDYPKQRMGNIGVQVLRSAAHWSAGNKTEEKSIFNGMIELIHNAKHYIIIENQFFISASYERPEINWRKDRKRYKKIINE